EMSVKDTRVLLEQKVSGKVRILLDGQARGMHVLPERHVHAFGKPPGRWSAVDVHRGQPAWSGRDRIMNREPLPGSNSSEARARSATCPPPPGRPGASRRLPARPPRQSSR